MSEKLKFYRKEEHSTNVVSNTIPVIFTVLQSNRGTQSVRIETFLNLFSGNSDFLKIFIWDQSLKVAHLFEFYGIY